jgi:hypothetical protein
MYNLRKNIYIDKLLNIVFLLCAWLSTKGIPQYESISHLNNTLSLSFTYITSQPWTERLREATKHFYLGQRWVYSANFWARNPPVIN